MQSVNKTMKKEEPWDRLVARKGIKVTHIYKLCQIIYTVIKPNRIKESKQTVHAIREHVAGGNSIARLQ